MSSLPITEDDRASRALNDAYIPGGSSGAFFLVAQDSSKSPWSDQSASVSRNDRSFAFEMIAPSRGMIQPSGLKIILARVCVDKSPGMVAGAFVCPPSTALAWPSSAAKRS
jgi:hypothetical protein